MAALTISDHQFLLTVDLVNAIVNPGVSYADQKYSDMRELALTGVEIDQNVPPTLSSDYVVPDATNYIYQTFLLPTAYKREGVIAPDINGFQVSVTVSGDSTLAYLDYVLQYQGATWVTLTSGRVTGCHTSGEQLYFDIYFDYPVPVTDDLLGRKLRFGIRGNVDKVWYSQPNPYPNGQALRVDGLTPLVVGIPSSLRFRILTASGDKGVDFLNNTYRSAVSRNAATNISTQLTLDSDAYWLSKPNPSKFGIECLYLDVRDPNGNAQVIDRILVNPVTPGPYFHVYYSTDDSPANTVPQWENKLWTPISQSYRMTQRQEFALPEPIIAKYICLEFTRLQAQHYSPGTFQQPIQYRKYPKWVMDQFLTQQVVTANGDPFVSRRVNVIYNLLEFAFDYYLDDLRQNPTSPDQVFPIPSLGLLPSSASNLISGDTLTRINTTLHNYVQHLGLRSDTSTILGEFARSSADNSTYPVESLDVPLSSDTSAVTSLNRDAVLNEEFFPLMFFFLRSRHAYRIVEATFEHDRAYFVGIKELAFIRDQYAPTGDNSLYIESTGDITNTFRSDFANVNGTWAIVDSEDLDPTIPAPPPVIIS